MKIHQIAVAAAIAASAPAFAVTCTQTFNLKTLGPPATASLGNSFNGITLFSDCYDFSIDAPASAGGTTTETNSTIAIIGRFIDVLKVSLYTSAGSLVAPVDTTPGVFSFSGLAKGSYELVVSGYVAGLVGTASYSGTLSTTPTTVTSPVPEASLAGMLAIALVGAGLMTRRSRR